MKLTVRDIGRCSYRETLNRQKDLHRQRRDDEIGDTLLLVEHNPVYTLGKNADRSNILASDDFLEQEGIDVEQIHRGGDVTYHGPGQLVGYPIFHLKDHRKSVSWYMRTLEQVFVEYLRSKDLSSHRKEEHPGVWIEDQKIVAVGVRISRWVTMHGFGFNIDPVFSHFQGIIPCGISEYGVTSLHRCYPDDRSPPTMETVKREVVARFLDVFEFQDVMEETVHSSASEA